MRLSASISVAVVLAACKPAATPPPDNSAAARAGIDAVNANWPRLTSSGHADSLADYYTPDAVIMPPNMATVRGRDSIRAFFVTLNAVKPTLTLKALAVWGGASSATEMGRWNWSWAAGVAVPPGMPTADSGKYLVRWIEENGKWLIAQDIWNSDLPLPTQMEQTPRTTRH